MQPIEGLVVSVPVLVDAECLERQPPSVQDRRIELCPADAEGRPVLRDAWAVLEEILGLPRAAFDEGEALPEALMLYVSEGGQVLRLTAALRRAEDEDAGAGAGEGGAALDDSTPASRAGAAYSTLLWVLPPGVGLDKPEAVTGPWEYPPSANFDRLLRECRVPIGPRPTTRSRTPRTPSRASSSSASSQAGSHDDDPPRRELARGMV